MLTRIEIDGFKSFRRFALDLEPLQAIVGPNSAGKSNLFDALQLESRLATMDVYSAMKQGRGRVRDQFTRDREGAGTRMRFAVELFLPGIEPMSRFRYEVVLARQELPSGVEELKVEDEQLQALAESEDAWIARHPTYRPRAHYAQDGHVFSTGWRFGIGPKEGPVETEPAANFYGNHLLSGKTVLSYAPRDAILDAVSREFAGWRFLHVDASRLRAPSERAAATMLAPDGSNLATVLASLAPEVFAQVQAELCALIPGARALQILAQDDQFHIEVELTDDLRLPARVLSDGTLRILAFLALLRTAPPGSMIALEEPENGIFPGRLRAFLRKLRSATAADSDIPVQILLNSHSPTVLAALHDEPALLLFADMVRGQNGLKQTRMRPVSTQPLKDHGATQVSMREIDRLLQTASPEGVE